MRSSNLLALATLFTAAAGVLPKIDLPKDSPVALLSTDYGDSSETIRGGAALLDLHASLSLRNSTARRIRGITLLVTAQEVTPGGKGSVTVTSIDVGPGEAFPIHIDLRLLRPLQGAAGTPVQVGLDGVLFDDLSFYGPDNLKSHHTLAVCEWEARRDRRYFKSLLAEGGPQRLQQEMLASMARQIDRPDMNVQMTRAGRATNLEPDRQVQFAFLKIPDSPVEPITGSARIAGGEARSPRLEIQNKSDRAVRYMEIGWVVTDGSGKQFLAGTVPADLNLAPGDKAQVLKDTTLKLPQTANHPVSIESMAAFISNVEFADGRVWVPSRADLSDPQMRRIMAPSPEEQRLVQIYRKRGLAALVDELKKY